MLTNYIRAAMARAHYELLSDDDGFWGEITGFQGIWANAATLEACRDELEDVLQEWIIFRLAHELTLPVIDGLDLNFRERAAV